MAPALDVTLERESRISDEVSRLRPRLRDFVRRRVADAAEAEDILQDVLAELVAALRLPQPIEEVGAWLYRVARNRITDSFRRKKPLGFDALATEDGFATVEELLPSTVSGPEAAYARTVLLEELEAALEELPAAQRDVFIAHELEGRSFNELAAESGVSLNTLLSRKRYAVLHLRRRLRDIHDAFLDMGGN